MLAKPRSRPIRRSLRGRADQSEFDEFVTSRIDESIGPQIKVCLLDSGSPAVALTMNHMAGDAAAFKDYLYLLCRTYTGILADPGYEPVAIAGDRSMRGVLRRFGMAVKLKSLLSHSKENNRSGDHRFPLSEGGDVRPFILTRKLGRESLEAIHGYCTTRRATLNDAVLAAYYRCLFRSLALPCGAELRLPVMVDMRRYLDDGAKSGALANLSSTVITRLELRPEERFADTLARIKAEMDDKKGGDLGLNGFIKLDLVYKLLPDRRANHLLRSRLKNPLICMTNVGILDAARLSLGDQRPRDAFLCGSIKHKPHFQLAMSSYDGELTLSANLYGTAADRERVASFLDDVERELCTACSGPSAATDALAPGGGGVCPAEHAGWLATPLRRLLQDPRRILDGLVAAGDTAIDFGCGPGFFTLPMAELVGPGGRVVAVDLQAGDARQAATARRARRAFVAHHAAPLRARRRRRAACRRRRPGVLDGPRGGQCHPLPERGRRRAQAGRSVPAGRAARPRVGGRLRGDGRHRGSQRPAAGGHAARAPEQNDDV